MSELDNFKRKYLYDLVESNPHLSGWYFDHLMLFSSRVGFLFKGTTDRGKYIVHIGVGVKTSVPETIVYRVARKECEYDTCEEYYNTKDVISLHVGPDRDRLDPETIINLIADHNKWTINDLFVAF